MTVHRGQWIGAVALCMAGVAAARTAEPAATNQRVSLPVASADSAGSPSTGDSPAVSAATRPASSPASRPAAAALRRLPPRSPVESKEVGEPGAGSTSGGWWKMVGALGLVLALILIMRWLVRLVTPPGGIVLDPFMGSGSTGCAALLEGFDFVGIELDKEYIEIAQRRIDYWAKQRKEEHATDV